MFNKCVLPVLTYGAAVWNLTDTQMKQLQTAHRKMLQCMLGWKKKSRTDHDLAYHVACERMKCMPIMLQIRKCQLTWFVNVLRMDDERLPKIMTFGSAVFQNKRASSLRWKVSVKRSLKLFELDDDVFKWQNPPAKREWKTLLDTKSNVARENWLHDQKIIRAKRHLIDAVKKVHDLNAPVDRATATAAQRVAIDRVQDVRNTICTIARDSALAQEIITSVMNSRLRTVTAPPSQLAATRPYATQYLGLTATMMGRSFSRS